MAKLPEGFIQAGAHLWSPSERNFFESCSNLAEGTGDEIRVPGACCTFWVIPMVRAMDNEKFNEPRRPWHTGKNRRPRYWAVAQTDCSEGPASLWHNLWVFPTRAKAIEKAKELAHEDKVMDLLEAN